MDHCGTSPPTGPDWNPGESLGQSPQWSQRRNTLGQSLGRFETRLHQCGDQSQTRTGPTQTSVDLA